MIKQSALQLLILGAALASGGCDAQTIPDSTRPVSLVPTTHPSGIPSHHDLMLFVNDAHPHFAGFYIDDSGEGLHINVTGPSDLQAIAGLLGDLFGPGLGARALVSVQGHDVRYTYRELLDMLYSGDARVLRAHSHVMFYAIDDRRNRLHFDFREGASETEIREAITESGLPADAVSARWGGVLVQDATLQDRRRPNGGGLRIQVDIDDNSFQSCTMSPILQMPSNDDDYEWGFLTNSHCTMHPAATPGWGVPHDHTWAYQNDGALAGDQVGAEYVDPAPFQGAPVCPDHIPCRRSDAAFFAFDLDAPSPPPHTVASRFKILVTAGPNSIVLPAGAPVWPITAEAQPTPNRQVSITGASTGWRQGHVEFVGGSFVVGSTFRIINQATASYESSPGDSGAPVTNHLHTSEVAEEDDNVFFGLHHSRSCFQGSTEEELGECTSVFSPIEEIEADLGLLVTFEGDQH